jgi:hypothetical protein
MDAIIFAVGHEEYRPLHGEISDMLGQDGVIADVGSRLDARTLRPDIRYWSL